MIFVNNVANQDYKVTWQHHQMDPIETPNGLKIRGTTNCTIVNRSGVFIGSGISHCSIQDNFNKEKGRKVSLRRALEQANFTKEGRTKFWNAYWDRIEEEEDPIDIEEFNEMGHSPRQAIIEDNVKLMSESVLYQFVECIQRELLNRASNKVSA